MILVGRKGGKACASSLIVWWFCTWWGLEWRKV